MITPGTEIRIPAGIPFLKTKNDEVIGDWKPVDRTKVLIFKYIAGPEMYFNSGYTKLADLVAAGVLKIENGELFVIENQVKQKTLCSASKIDQNSEQGNDKHGGI